MLEILNKNKKIRELNNEIEKLNQELIKKEDIKEKYINEIDALAKDKEKLENKISKLIEKEKFHQEKVELRIKMLREAEKYFIESYLDAIDTMPGIKFETFMGGILRKIGYDVEVTKASGDNGADIIAKDKFKKYAIQCKRYTGNVGFDAVKEAHTAKDIYDCDVGVVLTNVENFTKEAIANSRKLNVLLWNRDYIKTMLAKAYEIDLDSIERGEGIYIEKIVEEPNIEIDNEEDDIDPLLMEAIDAVIETNQASTSFIQRRFKIGYARAGRIIDQMEERGIISSYQGSKPREVLMSKERLIELNRGVNN